MVQNSINLHDNARSYTAVAVTDLLCRWQWAILEHPPYWPEMSLWYYDLFAKVKEPLRGIHYNRWTYPCYRAVNTNINKDGRADGVRRLQNIWQKVINKGATILKVWVCPALVSGHFWQFWIKEHQMTLYKYNLRSIFYYEHIPHYISFYY